jgi:two-component system, OmpR family, alkaline phosphatase synthesis response regulator PhoP
MKNTILIIDTELNNYQRLKERFEQFQFIVYTFSDNQEGLYGINHLKPDLIIYNFHLFLLSEKNFYDDKNRQLLATPIIMVGSSKKEEDVLYAFQKGAADYLTNPIHSRELEARVKAILRRIEMTDLAPTNQIKLGDYVLKYDEYEIDLITHKVNLSKRELQVLLLIMERKIISREEILRCIWGDDYSSDSRIVDVIVSNLRKKIEKDPRKPQYLKTIKGFGYRFDEPRITPS